MISIQNQVNSLSSASRKYLMLRSNILLTSINVKYISFARNQLKCTDDKCYSYRRLNCTKKFCSSHFIGHVWWCSDVRLIGGSLDNGGRLEVKYGGVWGTVCDDYFDDIDAGVACNSLGFGSVNTVHCFCINHLLQQTDQYLEIYKKSMAVGKNGRSYCVRGTVTYSCITIVPPIYVDLCV